MRGIFEKCSSLNYLPDISKWNTINVKDMYGMFNNCIILLSLMNLKNK